MLSLTHFLRFRFSLGTCIVPSALSFPLFVSTSASLFYIIILQPLLPIPYSSPHHNASQQYYQLLLPQPAIDSHQPVCFPPNYRLLSVPHNESAGFVQKLKCFFPGFSRTCKDQIPGLSRTQKSFFPGLSRTRSIHKHGLHEVKKEHIQNQFSVHLHYSKESKMQYPRLVYFI